jgi:ribosomal subunit interface protein
MNIITSARHFDLTQPLKETVQATAHNLHHTQNVNKVEVVLHQEHGVNQVEIHVDAKGGSIHAMTSHADMYKTISDAFDIVQRQLTERFQILTDHTTASNENLLQG